MDAVQDYLSGPMPELRRIEDYEESAEADAILNAKREAARAVVRQARDRWQRVLGNLDAPRTRTTTSSTSQPAPGCGRRYPARPAAARDLVQSYRREVAARLADIFSGQDSEAVRQRLAAIHAEIRDARLFVALHMHAGDGNVHTNIPCTRRTTRCCAKPTTSSTGSWRSRSRWTA